MLDFDSARENMVDCQVRTVDVTNHEVLEAFLEVPREDFIPEEKRELAYLDEDIEIASGRYVMEPAPLAKLIQAAQVKQSDIVLDLACGTGYTTAILSKLASMVIAVEGDAGLAEKARRTLETLDCDNTVVINGAAPDGYASEGPYDVIFAGGAVGEVPKGLLDQLREGGKLMTVIGQGNSAIATLISREGDQFSARSLFNCGVRPIPGFEKPEEFVF